MKQFRELQAEHERLLKKQINDEIVLADIEAFINQIVVSSKKISSPGERDQLRANLRYWSNYLYEETGEYPNKDLYPSSRDLFILPSAIGIIGLIIGAIISLYRFFPAITNLHVVTMTPHLLSTPCAVQPINNYFDFNSNSNHSLIMVLVDQSIRNRKLVSSSLDLIPAAIVPSMEPGDRLIVSWVERGEEITTATFFDEVIPIVDFPVIPATPTSPLLTPTIIVPENAPSLQMVQVQVTNAAINSNNEARLQQEYYCKVSAWNSNAIELSEMWLQEQTRAIADFSNDAKTAIDTAQNTPQTIVNSSSIGEFLFFASRQLQYISSKYSQVTLVVFSDMRLVGNEEELNIDLAGVDVIVANQGCNSAIECQNVAEFWDKKLKSSGANSVLFLTSDETTAGNLNSLISSEINTKPSVVLSITDKGYYLDVIGGAGLFHERYGPLSNGVYKVEPNNRFLVYVAYDGSIYLVTFGDSQMAYIGKVENFSAIEKNEQPDYSLVFTKADDGSYSLVIGDLKYAQYYTIQIPPQYLR